MDRLFKKSCAGLGPLALPVWFAAFQTFVFVSGRAADSWYFRQDVPEPHQHLLVFLVGFRIDLSTICYQSILPILALLLLSRPAVRASSRLLAAYVAAMVGVSLFLELATPSFIKEFGLRPNQLLLDHLFPSGEIVWTVIADHPGELIVALVLEAIAVAFAYRAARRLLEEFEPWPRRRLVWAGPAVLLLAVLGARGRLFKGQAMGLSVAEFSNIGLVNQLALNSTYSFGNALGRLRFESSPQAVYRYKMAPGEMLDRVKRRSNVGAADFIDDPENPLLHRQRSRVKTSRPRNLVIILEESLGAEYVGSLGGMPLTPRFDRLGKEGLLFTRLYATGTRSARGIEAVLSGFLPTPGESVIKLGKSQADFFTVARLLRSRGYRTSFIYGGDSNFDNMRSFALHNGFDEIIDQRDFKGPVFEGVWGVSDEDVMRKADHQFALRGDQPFFTLIFTTSNHAPFEFPGGRIELYEQPKATVHNTIKYADYCLGLFFDLARKSAYAKETVFIVLADHNYRNFGSGLVPVHKMHIPGLLLAPGLKPALYGKTASQLDLVPTALSLLGIDLVHPMLGHDVLALPKDHPGRAILQFGDNNAYMEGDRVLTIQPRALIKQFVYDHNKEDLEPVDQVDADLRQTALAHALLPGWLYKERKYR